MTPQDVIGLTPPRGLLALVAVILTAMAGCFWTPETEVQTDVVRLD